MQWIAENLATILICLVLAGIVCAIIVSMVRKRKRGGSCDACGSCGSCPMSGSCDRRKGGDPS